MNRLQLNIYHYIIILIIILIFVNICYHTLFRVRHRYKKITKICNNDFFILMLGTVYFFLLVVFTYETSDSDQQCQHHSFLKKCGIYVPNSIVFLFFVFLMILIKYKDYIYDMYNL